MIEYSKDLETMLPYLFGNFDAVGRNLQAFAVHDDGVIRITEHCGFLDDQARDFLPLKLTAFVFGNLSSVL